MRPKKKVMIYHPQKCEGALFCYAMNIRLLAEVSVASSPAELNSHAGETPITVEWATEYRYSDGQISWLKEIRVQNHHANTLNTLPGNCQTADLMEAVRLALRRKSNHERKVIHDKTRAAAVAVGPAAAKAYSDTACQA